MPRTSPPAGPGASSTSSSSSCGAPHGATAATGIALLGSGPTASASPARSGAGRCPREHVGRARAEHGGAAEPAAHGEVAARAVCEPVECSSAPAGHACASYGSTSCPASRIGPHAPVTANHRSREATARSPPIVASITAASSGLPTSRFAVRAAPRSSAPDGATPSDAAAGPPEVLQGREQPGLDDPHAGPCRGSAGRQAAGSARCRTRGCSRGQGRGRPSRRGRGGGGAEAHARARREQRRVRRHPESNSGASVVPISRHPPGVSRGYAPVKPAGEPDRTARARACAGIAQPGHVERPVGADEVAEARARSR